MKILKKIRVRFKMNRTLIFIIVLKSDIKERLLLICYLSL